MDIDLFKIGIQNHDISENDDELLKELRALQEEETINVKPISQPPMRQKAQATSNLRRLSADHDREEVELTEADMDDDNLLTELNDILGADEKNKEESGVKEEKLIDGQKNYGQKRGEEEIPADPTNIASSPALSQTRQQGSSTARPIQEGLEIESRRMGSTSVQDVSLKNRAHSLLMRRRKLYLERAKSAKEVNDRETAMEAFETVKLFNQALEAMKEGAELTEEDLAQIPPSPAPYIHPSPESKMSGLDEKPIGKDEGRVAATSPPSTAVHEKADESFIISEELRLAMMRQMQLKKVALEAKQKGDLTTAKEYLRLAHRMDQMVEAAKCGLPIDIQQIPNVPSSLSEPISNSKKSPVANETLTKKCQLLEREFIKQIELCTRKASLFQSVGDAKNVMFYEKLQQKSKESLHRVQMAMLGNSELPGFKLTQLLLPNIELNPSIPEDQLHLQIAKIENLRLPPGWKPSDCSLFVLYKFPFPHDSQQTGRTSIVRGTISPEFPDIFQLKINRRTKQFARICKRIPLKLEIYHKGGFFRSDRLFGHAEVNLQELEHTALIQDRFEILEGRKKMGSFIHVQIRINRPLAGDAKGSTAPAGIKQKWVELVP